MVRIICEQRGEPPQASVRRRDGTREELRLDYGARASVEDRRLGNPRRGGRVSHAGAGLRLRPGVRHVRAVRAAWWWAATRARAAKCCSTPCTAGCWPPAARWWMSASCPRRPFRFTSPPPRARGGIALTASHNPPEYNALKLFNAAGPVLQSLRAQRTARPVPPERVPAGDQRGDPRHRDANTKRRRGCTSSAC